MDIDVNAANKVNNFFFLNLFSKISSNKSSRPEEAMKNFMINDCNLNNN